MVGSERSRVEKGSRPDSVGLETGFMGDLGEEDVDASFSRSGVEDEFEGPGCSASTGCWATWAWAISFLLFLLFFLLEFGSVGFDFDDIYDWSSVSATIQCP